MFLVTNNITKVYKEVVGDFIRFFANLSAFIIRLFFFQYSLKKVRNFQLLF